MPRLSGTAEPPALHRRGAAAATAGGAAAAAPAVVSPAAPPPQPPARVAAPPPPQPAPLPRPAPPRPRAGAGAEGVPPPPQHDYLKEPRVYRQPDGSLGPKKPPPDPYTVANRRAWADLVHYARTHGGDAECTAGRSFRYGVGVSYAQHVAYLESIGLEPERDQNGNWFGYDPTKEDPLDDEEHPFYAAEQAAKESPQQKERDAFVKQAVDAELAFMATQNA